jgi:GNAT superfamily N-acetyltransferase
LPADSKDYELNEVSWWSKWVEETVWVSKNSYAIFSEAFGDEFFFNRAGFVGVERVPADAVDAIEKEFVKRRRAIPCILVEVGRPWDKMRSSLSKKGYSPVERMVVMEGNRRPKLDESDVEVVVAGKKEIQEWTRTYLEAFYGNQTHAKEVNGIMKQAVKDKESSVILARIGGEAAGCAALHRSKGGVAGAYCIGTVPKHRKKGVAAAMIGFMGALAGKEKRRLIIQTLASDSLEGFYQKQGFKVAYAKTYFERTKTSARDTISSGKDLGVVINRGSAAAGATRHFPEVFGGFESVGAVRQLFGPDTKDVLAKLKVSMTSRGYLRVDGETGDIIINPEYLRTGPDRWLYLDVIHELTHVRQFKEGKELYDRRYSYLERPTEIEAYETAVEEARRIGMDPDEIVDYLRVEWVTEAEFASFVTKMRIR